MLKLNDVSYSYKGSAFKLKCININTVSHRTIGLLGGSGCGKSTLLSVIMGILKADSGSIFVDQKCVDGKNVFIPPERRKLGVVFQHSSLFPYKTVAENISLAVNNYRNSGNNFSVSEILAIFDLLHLANFYPYSLSGGQQQTITVARALAANPRLILMDEPFSSLDFMLRRNIRRKVFSLLRKFNTQVLLVTHDPEEAAESADFIYIMKDGEIIRAGSPKEVYENPGSKYVMQIFDEPLCLKIQFESNIINTPFGYIMKESDISFGSEAELCFGSDSFRVSDSGTEVKVESCCPIGGYFRFVIDDYIFKVSHCGIFPNPGDIVRVTPNSERIFLFRI